MELAPDLWPDEDELELDVELEPLPELSPEAELVETSPEELGESILAEEVQLWDLASTLWSTVEPSQQ